MARTEKPAPKNLPAEYKKVLQDRRAFEHFYGADIVTLIRTNSSYRSGISAASVALSFSFLRALGTVFMGAGVAIAAEELFLRDAANVSAGILGILLGLSGLFMLWKFRGTALQVKDDLDQLIMLEKD